jgi:hypothetical protein
VSMASNVSPGRRRLRRSSMRTVDEFESGIM